MPRTIRLALACLALGSCLAGASAFAAETAWDGGDLDCAACHTKEAAADGTAEKPSNSKEAPQDTAATGKKAADDPAAPAGAKASDAAALTELHPALTCVSCHDDEKLAKLHDDASADSKMPKKLKKTDVSEELCLGCHAPEQLSELTENCTLLTDDNGTVVNPHALPGVADHDPISCVDCHTAHGAKPAEEAAPAKCLSCHHENVYECGTCH